MQAEKRLLNLSSQYISQALSHRGDYLTRHFCLLLKFRDDGGFSVGENASVQGNPYQNQKHQTKRVS